MKATAAAAAIRLLQGQTRLAAEEERQQELQEITVLPEVPEAAVDLRAQEVRGLPGRVMTEGMVQVAPQVQRLEAVAEEPAK